ncbi:MAG TPA: response regulator, partial [Verrucomicrobiae bacterium]|nr:response regulator [Verrucomicrobiae bacterium]
MKIGDKSAADRGVLLVDDDHDVRTFVGQSLEIIGYHVVHAASARQALAQFEKHRSEISLVLTDMIMPGDSGDLLALALLIRDPELKVIFMSGNPPDLLGSRVELVAGRNFLQKP